MRNAFLVLLSLLAVDAVAQDSDPMTNFGSIYPRRSANLIETRNAMRKGDLVTIVIREQTQANFQAATTATKQDTTEVERSNLPFVNDVLRWLRIPNLSSILAPKSTGANSTVNGAGTTTANSVFNGRIAVTVVDVRGNNLVIQGTKEILLNKERVTLTFSGVIRRDDVRPDNSILSENVADARIEATGRGVISDRQRRGLLTQVLDWLF